MGKHTNFTWGVHQVKGSRNYMEDGYTVIENFNELIHDNTLHDTKRSFFGVYDGHGGDACMHFIKKTLHLELARAYMETSGDTVGALKLAFSWTEDKWMDQVKELGKGKADVSGSTATVCLLEGNEVFCAYLGDSPAFTLCHKSKKATELTKDHKPNDKDEQKRIKKAGGSVKKQKGTYRLFPGGFAVSRSFGDPAAKLKEFGGVPGTMLAEPEISQSVIKENFNFLVICSDGLTDNIANHHDTYLPLLQGYHPGIKKAKSKKGKKVKDIDYQVCTQEMTTELVNSLTAKKGYQDNTTALVLMFDSAHALLEIGAHDTMKELRQNTQLNNLF